MWETIITVVGLFQESPVDGNEWPGNKVMTTCFVLTFASVLEDYAAFECTHEVVLMSREVEHTTRLRLASSNRKSISQKLYKTIKMKPWVFEWHHRKGHCMGLHLQKKFLCYTVQINFVAVLIQYRINICHQDDWKGEKYNLVKSEINDDARTD